MIKYMMLCKNDSIKGLPYGKILTGIFSRNIVSSEGIMGMKPNEGDRIDRECFWRLHLV